MKDKLNNLSTEKNSFSSKSLKKRINENDFAEEQRIIKRYLEDKNLTVTKLAKEINKDRNTVARILRKNGVIIRRVRHLTEQEKTEIISKYSEGNISIEKLAKAYKVNFSSIYGVLKKAGKLEPKDGTGSIKSFSEEIIKEYLENDITHAEIAEKYSCERSSITHIINKAEVSNPKYKQKRKSFGERKNTPKKKLSITPAELIAEKIRTGLSYSKLAKKYHVSESCIYHAIARHRGKKN